MFFALRSCYRTEEKKEWPWNTSETIARVDFKTRVLLERPGTCSGKVSLPVSKNRFRCALFPTFNRVCVVVTCLLVQPTFQTPPFLSSPFFHSETDSVIEKINFPPFCFTFAACWPELRLFRRIWRGMEK